MNINKLTKYDVFVAEIKRFIAVDELFWKNLQLRPTTKKISDDYEKALAENRETEAILNKRFGI